MCGCRGDREVPAVRVPLLALTYIGVNKSVSAVGQPETREVSQVVCLSSFVHLQPTQYIVITLVDSIFSHLSRALIESSDGRS